MPGQNAVRVRRRLFARLFAGFALQQILTGAVVISLFLIGVLLAIGSASALPAAIGPGVVFWIIWGLGVTAHAEADDGAVRWRYYAPRRFGWDEIDGLEFGGAIVKGTGSFGQPVIRVIAGGRPHPISPAYGCDAEALAEFGRGLVVLAERSRTPVTVTAYEDAVWGRLRGG